MASPSNLSTRMIRGARFIRRYIPRDGCVEKYPQDPEDADDSEDPNKGAKSINRRQRAL